MDGQGGGLDGQNTLFSQRDYDTMEGHGAIVLQAESPTVGDLIRLNIRSTIGQNDIVESPATAYGEWHHYAGVVSSDSVYLYLDGELMDVVPNTQAGTFDVGIDLIEIGRHYHANSYLAGSFNGFMDNLRIWDGALSGTEILDAKNAQLQTIQFPLLAHWDFEDNDFHDISENGHNGIAMGDAEIVQIDAEPIDFGYSLLLDGDGDYVSLPTYILSEAGYTIEAWACMLGPGGGLDGQNTIFSHRDYNTIPGEGAVILNAESPAAGDRIRFNIGTDDGPNDIVEYPAPAYGEWHHYAGVVSLDSVFLYFDGIKVDAVEYTQTGNYYEGIDIIEIGRHYHENNYVAGYFNGYIDNLRIWDGPLNESQILDAKNSELQNVQISLLAHWDFESNDFLDVSQNGHNGIAEGDAHVEPFNPLPMEFGLSLFLDGIDDFASLPNPIIHSTEFTIEIWAAMIGPGGGLDQQNTLFEQRDYDTEENRSAIILTGENSPAESLTRFTIRSNQGVADGIGTQAPEYGSWHHYAGVLSHDSLYLYLDGELVSSGVNNQTGAFDWSIDDVDIGRHYHADFYPAGFFNGFIDEVKIWSSPRSQAQVRADQFGQLLGTEDDLIAYYNFENEFVEDLTQMENHGQLENGAIIIPANFHPDLCEVMGDVDGDRMANISDVVGVVHYTLGLPGGEFNEECADLSGDENINVIDVILLIEYLLGE